MSELCAEGQQAAGMETLTCSYWQRLDVRHAGCQDRIVHGLVSQPQCSEDGVD